MRELIRKDQDRQRLRRLLLDGAESPLGLPADWVARAFDPIGDDYCLRPALQRAVTFELRNIRQALPEGPFQLILCRNLAFSYFDDPEQRRVLRDLIARLKPGGYLVIGAHEQLPGEQPDLRRIAQSRCIYRRVA